MELSPQQVEHHQCQDTVEGVNPKLLICPVEGGAETEIVRIFQTPEVGLHVVLGAIS